MVGGMHGRGHAWQGACVGGETATAVGGTHPTGMHSCNEFKLPSSKEPLIVGKIPIFDKCKRKYCYIVQILSSVN